LSDTYFCDLKKHRASGIPHLIFWDTGTEF